MSQWIEWLNWSESMIDRVCGDSGGEWEREMIRWWNGGCTRWWIAKMVIIIIQDQLQSECTGSMRMRWVSESLMILSVPTAARNLGFITILVDSEINQRGNQTQCCSISLRSTHTLTWHIKKKKRETIYPIEWKVAGARRTVLRRFLCATIPSFTLRFVLLFFVFKIGGWRSRKSFSI